MFFTKWNLVVKGLNTFEIVNVSIESSNVIKGTPKYTQFVFIKFTFGRRPLQIVVARGDHHSTICGG